MRKFKDLTAADFPGVDPQKFQEWRLANHKGRENLYLFWFIILFLNMFLLGIFGKVAFPGIGLLLFVSFFAGRRARRLTKELGITRESIKRALQADAAPGPGVDQPPLPRLFMTTFGGVLVSPRETFAEIVRKPDFIYPLLVTVISSVAVTETMLAKLGMERIIRNSLEMSGQAEKMNPDQIQQAVERGVTVGSIMAHAGGLLGAPIYLLIVAAIGLAIVNALFGSPVSFKKAFSVTCYANVVGVIGALMAVAMIFFGDVERFNPNNPAPTNLGFFLNPLETSKPVAAFASSVDLFTIWFVILLGIGFSQATGGKVKARTIFLVYFGLWMVWVLGKVGLAAIF